MNLRRILLLSALLLAAPLARGQEPPKPVDDPHKEMQKLIGEVELRLRQIDKLLADAGAPQRAQAGASAKTAELVKRSQDQGKQVVEAIDKILELADHPHPPGSS